MPALAGAAAMLVAVLLGGVLFGDGLVGGDEPGRVATRPDWDGLKGDRLRIYRRVGAREEPLAAGQRVSEGDIIQVAYVAGGAARGVIVSVDGAGQVTRHFPEAAHGSNALKAGSVVALPHSYELDDAPRFERFFFVFAEPGVPLNTAEVEDAAWALARSGEAAKAPLPIEVDGVRVESVLLKKGGHR